MVDWIKTEERRPKDGATVLAYWYDPLIGSQAPMYGVTEYHYRKARQELNSHIWHAVDNDEDDYREPEYWAQLPEAPVP